MTRERNRESDGDEGEGGLLAFAGGVERPSKAETREHAAKREKCEVPSEGGRWTDGKNSLLPLLELWFSDSRWD